MEPAAGGSGRVILFGQLLGSSDDSSGDEDYVPSEGDEEDDRGGFTASQGAAGRRGDDDEEDDSFFDIPSDGFDADEVYACARARIALPDRAPAVPSTFLYSRFSCSIPFFTYCI